MAHRITNSPPLQSEVHLGERGRIVLPASIRRRVGLHPGDRLVLIAEDSGEIRIVGLRQQVQGCQGMFQRSDSKGVRPSEELIAERRLEAAREKQH